MVMHDSTDPTTYRSTTKLKVCKEVDLTVNFCKGHSGDVSVLQQFIMPPNFLLVELPDNCIGQLVFPLTVDMFGQNYVLKGMVQCGSHHFTVAIKDGIPWVYVDDMCDSVKNYTSCQDFFHSYPEGWFFAIFEKSKDMHLQLKVLLSFVTVTF